MMLTLIGILLLALLAPIFGIALQEDLDRAERLRPHVLTGAPGEPLLLKSKFGAVVERHTITYTHTLFSVLDKLDNKGGITIDIDREAWKKWEDEMRLELEQRRTRPSTLEIDLDGIRVRGITIDAHTVKQGNVRIPLASITEVGVVLGRGKIVLTTDEHKVALHTNWQLDHAGQVNWIADAIRDAAAKSSEGDAADVPVALRNLQNQKQ